MKNIKKGDIVVRKSYGKDIVFYVKNIIRNREKQLVILVGILERIEADSLIEDLEKIDKKEFKKILKKNEEKIKSIIINKKRELEKIQNNRFSQDIVTGKILHLDGDRRYSKKSMYYYNKFGVKAVVKNIPEYRQPKEVYQLLKYYNPDILVITGHDSMIRKGKNYNDIYNYRNSKYFINTVKEARRYDENYNKNTVIFAGACQSYFEALIMAGADFASSPGRILIDFLDPLIVAQIIATTEKYKYISMDDIANELRDGKKGIGGTGVNGKMKVV